MPVPQRAFVKRFPHAARNVCYTVAAGVTGSAASGRGCKRLTARGWLCGKKPKKATDLA